MSTNYYLHKSAREAYRSYMQAYAQHTLKNIFNVHALDVLAVSKSFGFDAPPKVHLKISLKTLQKSEKRAKSQAMHGFSEDNPYGNGHTNAAEDEKNEARAKQAQEAVTKSKPVKQWSR